MSFLLIKALRLDPRRLRKTLNKRRRVISQNNMREHEPGLSELASLSQAEMPSTLHSNFGISYKIAFPPLKLKTSKMSRRNGEKIVSILYKSLTLFIHAGSGDLSKVLK